MRAAILGAALLVALALTWLAGEQHRRTCEQAELVSCSVLPWDSGQAPPPDPHTLILR